MKYRIIPITNWEPLTSRRLEAKPLWIEPESSRECVTVNGIPRVYVNNTAYTPDLEAWAKQRESVQAELERRGITVLSELTEEREKTMRSIAWDDMQRYINGGE